ncbi:MAG: glycoside hydrolase family 26 protein [Streptosporangiaceae bacterium]
MRARLVTLLGFVIAVTIIAVTGQRIHLTYQMPVVREKLPPRLSSYLGVYEPGAPPEFRPVEQFSDTAGRLPNLVEYYSGWAEPFDISFADLMHRHHIIPLVQIDPTFASISGIAHGAYDDYLRSYADSVRSFDHPVVIGFGHEMNGSWYPWGYTHVQPSTFVAAWRHIVSLFAGQGAENVTWLWTINQDHHGTGPIKSWWPGDRYVSWVGIDGYYLRASDTFRTVFGTTIRQVRTFTQKPVLLSETGVGRGSTPFAEIQDLFAGMQQYQTLGLVWFDADQSGSILRQNWRLEDDPTGAVAFRLGVSTRLARS